jgi:hypothetical protein
MTGKSLYTDLLDIAEEFNGLDTEKRISKNNFKEDI